MVQYVSVECVVWDLWPKTFWIMIFKIRDFCKKKSTKSVLESRLLKFIGISWKMFHCALKSFYCVLGAQECVIHCAQVVSGGMGWLNSKESSKLKIKSKKINPLHHHKYDQKFEVKNWKAQPGWTILVF